MSSSFATSLREELSAIGVAVRQISQQPEEWRVGAMTLAVDRARDRATLRYARQPVAVGVECRGAAVARAYRRVCARLESESLEPDALFEAIARAYAAALERRGAAPGSRVPLIELAGAVAEAVAGRYTRAQFAFDLVRLRREAGLVSGGLRLDLGIATGAATSKKSQVLWIEDQAGAGHYYQTLRLLPAPPGART